MEIEQYWNSFQCVMHNFKSIWQIMKFQHFQIHIWIKSIISNWFSWWWNFDFWINVTESGIFIFFYWTIIESVFESINSKILDCWLKNNFSQLWNASFSIVCNECGSLIFFNDCKFHEATRLDLWELMEELSFKWIFFSHWYKTTISNVWNWTSLRLVQWLNAPLLIFSTDFGNIYLFNIKQLKLEY